MTEKTTIKVDIVSAEEQIYSGEVSMVFAPAANGEIGIAPRHTPLLTLLQPGDVRLVSNGAGNANHKDEEIFYVSGGILEVQPHAVTVLADSAIRADKLDIEAAMAAKEKAEKALKEQKEAEYARTLSEITRAVAQIRAVQKLRRRGRRT